MRGALRPRSACLTSSRPQRVTHSRRRCDEETAGAFRGNVMEGIYRAAPRRALGCSDRFLTSVYGWLVCFFVWWKLNTRQKLRLFTHAVERPTPPTANFLHSTRESLGCWYEVRTRALARRHNARRECLSLATRSLCIIAKRCCFAWRAGTDPILNPTPPPPPFWVTRESCVGNGRELCG